jgi:tetraacyldisaccharide 4'-kinase
MTIEEEGAIVVSEYASADHQEVLQEELRSFAQQSRRKGAECLVCTEKDRVKLPDVLLLDIPIYWLEMELFVVEGIEDWQSFIGQAESKLVNTVI